MTVVFFSMAITAGALMVIQSSINGQLRVRLGDPWQAALISTSVSTLSLLVISGLATRTLYPDLGKIAEGPWWLWTGGVLGAGIVAASLFLVSRLGSAVLFALVVTGQMVAALILDHLGALGLQTHHVNPQRVLGVLLLLAGVVLIRLY